MTLATKTDSRLEQRFRLWDVDGNGVIERSDFEAEADGIVSRLGAEGTPKGDILKRIYMAMFERLAEAAGTPRMTRETFLEVADREIISRGDDGFSLVTPPTIQAIGLTGAEAAQAFAELDTDGSGKLSTTELVDAVRDYHLGRNDIPLLGN